MKKIENTVKKLTHLLAVHESESVKVEIYSLENAKIEDAVTHRVPYKIKIAMQKSNEVKVVEFIYDPFSHEYYFLDTQTEQFLPLSMLFSCSGEICT